MLLSGLTALAAKIASASTVAQATCGLGLAVAGITGAGAAGVLPGAVQDGVAGAVESITPFELPHTADDHAVERHSGAVTAEDPAGTDDSPAADAVPTPSTVPPVVLPAPAATPGTSSATEVEAHGTETGDDGGVHQHRGGRTGTPAAGSPGGSRSSVPAVTSAPTPASHEVEDHSGDDRSGRNVSGDDSAGDRSGEVRSGGDSGGDRSADDRSGGDDSGSHGGGSDDSSRHGGRDD
jgi:hypothetical protein